MFVKVIIITIQTKLTAIIPLTLKIHIIVRITVMTTTKVIKINKMHMWEQYPDINLQYQRKLQERLI